MHPLQQTRGRYGEVGDVANWPSVEVWLVEFLRPVGLSDQYKEVCTQFGRCPYSLLVSFSGNIMILEVSAR